jgi:hypothetical protein
MLKRAKRMLDVAEKVIVECHAHREPFPAAPGGHGSGKPSSRNRPEVPPQVTQLLTESCALSRWDQLPPGISLPRADRVIDDCHASPSPCEAKHPDKNTGQADLDRSSEPGEHRREP